MKKTLTIALIAISFACKGQVTQTVPMNSLRHEYPQNGVYFKDLNNELTYWDGTWEATLNNKKYTFVFTKFVQHLDSFGNDYYYEDKLLGKYKVVDLATNQTLYNNLSATNYDDYSIRGLSIRNGNFSFWFRDDASKCYNSVQFSLQKINGQPNQIRYCNFRFDEYHYFNCPNYDDQLSIPMFLPQENVILIKQ